LPKDRPKPPSEQSCNNDIANIDKIINDAKMKLSKLNKEFSNDNQYQNSNFFSKYPEVKELSNKQNKLKAKRSEYLKEMKHMKEELAYC